MAKRQLPHPDCPPRSQWKEFCNFVLGEFSFCDKQNRGNVLKRINQLKQIYVIQINCTYETYLKCILPVLNAYGGVTLSYKQHDARMTLGVEYDYVLVFTPNPMDAENYYVDDQGVLREQ